MSQTSPPIQNVPRRAVPAWALSLVTHLVLVFALACFVQDVTQTRAIEQDRTVGVVLASGGESEAVEYFDESDAAQSDVAQAAATPAAAAALPASQSPAPTLPDIALPGAVDLSGSPTDGMFQLQPVQSGGRAQILPNMGDERIMRDEAASRLRRAGPVGPPAQMSLFGGGPVVGHSFVFVIDRSKSMGSDGLGVLDAAAEQLRVNLAGLKQNHKFQIIAYHHAPLYMSERRLLKATDENKQEVGTFFESLAAFGSTDHEHALNAALRLEPDVIYFLTDGGDPYLTGPQLAQLKKRAKSKTTFHCLQFGFGPLQEQDNFMQRLAATTNGTFHYVNMSKVRKR